MSSVQFNPAYPHNLSPPAVAHVQGAAREEAPSSPQSAYKLNSTQGPSCFLPDGVQDISEITFINPKERQKTDGKLLGGVSGDKLIPSPPSEVEAGYTFWKIVRAIICIPIIILFILGIAGVVGTMAGVTVPICMGAALLIMSLYAKYKKEQALDEWRDYAYYNK